MKIAMFGHKHIPSRDGGVEVVVTQLSRRMAGLGHQVTCYNRGGKQTGEVPGVICKQVPTINKKGIAAVTSSISAAICVALSRAQVVHIHAEGPAFLCWLPRLMGKRVVVTVHGLDWQREKWKGGLGAKYIRMGERAAVRYAHRIIVLSANVQKYFLDTYGRQTVLIPNGVEIPEPVAPEEIRTLGLEKDSYILFLGRLVPEKGIHYLIEAFRQVSTDKKLVIAGGTSDTDAYTQQLHDMADGDERIVFTGFVQGRLLQELYSNAWVYCLPSDLEGMPLSLLEAMSYANCCLVSDIPEITEVTGCSAVTFPRSDITQLAQKLQQLCQDSEAVARCRSAAFAQIQKGHDWDMITQQTLQLYAADVTEKSKL